MYIQYTGFKVAINSRTYNFHVLDAAREPREFTVRIHSDTNLWAALKVQDGPGICFERLEQELGRETAAACAELNLHIREDDIREFLARHSPPREASEPKDLPELPVDLLGAPMNASSAVAGGVLSEPVSIPVKEGVAAILLHKAGNSMALLKLALESQSIKIRWLTTVYEVGPLLQGPDPPHLVFTEATLPDGTWADVVKHALGARQPVKVIVVSRLVDVRLYVHTMEGGAFDFIVPPLSAHELTHVVKHAVESVQNLRRAHSANA
jgi:hypothetical protein